MNTQLVEIQPRELKFVFEVKKQTSCAVYLSNVTDQYVAFKVKTTSPKKYCVRPNVGIIKPKSTYDFTVTMQAQKSAPLECKDKFLIQSTVVPFGTTEEEITPGMFSKESLKYIEETKLRVILTSPPNSPAKPRADVGLKQEASYETLMPKETHSPVLLPVNGFIQQELSYETKMPTDNLQNGVENSPPPDPLTKQVEAAKIVKNMEESRLLKVMDNKQSIPSKDEEFHTDRDDKSKQARDLEDTNSKLEDLRSMINALDSKLVEAHHTIEKLKEERNNSVREKETLKQELATLRTKNGVRKIQVGFPPLFVCMVALICLMIGYFYRG